MGAEEQAGRHLTVISRARQVRVAYLIDPEATPMVLLDAIFSACTHVWGGRLFPIIPVVRGEIPPAYWQLLRTTDPDSIYTYAKLPQVLIDQILKEIDPLRIEAHASHLFEGEHPLYSPSNLHQLVSVHSILPLALEPRWFRKPALVTYAGENGAPPSALIARNFGVLHNNILSERIPEDVTQVSFTEADDLPAFLERMAEQRELLVFPYAAAASQAVVELGREHFETSYTVFVGDAIEDWLAFWNDIFTVGVGSRESWKVLCVPASELQDQRTTAALSKFLRKMAHRNGRNQPYLNWVSSTLTEDELRRLSKPFRTDSLDAHFRFSQREQWSLPDVPEPDRHSFEFSGGGLGSAEVSSVSVHQIPRDGGLVDVPLLPFRASPDERWMRDVRVQYVSEYPYYSNEDLVYKLPRRNGITSLFCALPGRIDPDGGLSFEMRPRTPLMLQIPQDRNLVLGAIGTVPRSGLNEDLRRTETKPVYQNNGPSDKAKYFRGVLDLFGGLQAANQRFETRFWRETFYQLAGLGRRDSDGVQSVVARKIAKHPERWVIDPGLSLDDEVERIAKEVVKLARHVRVREDETTFQFLEAEFSRERAAFYERNPEVKASKDESIHDQTGHARSQLKRVLQGFVNAKILLPRDIRSVPELRLAYLERAFGSRTGIQVYRMRSFCSFQRGSAVVLPYE